MQPHITFNQWHCIIIYNLLLFLFCFLLFLYFGFAFVCSFLNFIYIWLLYIYVQIPQKGRIWTKQIFEIFESHDTVYVWVCTGNLPTAPHIHKLIYNEDIYRLRKLFLICYIISIQTTAFYSRWEQFSFVHIITWLIGCITLRPPSQCVSHCVYHT
jgi:hypothetical protein